jgi:hypothetical protein
MGNIYQTYGIVEKDAIIPANIMFKLLNLSSLNLKIFLIKIHKIIVSIKIVKTKANKNL